MVHFELLIMARHWIWACDLKIDQTTHQPPSFPSNHVRRSVFARDKYSTRINVFDLFVLYILWQTSIFFCVSVSIRHVYNVWPMCVCVWMMCVQVRVWKISQKYELPTQRTSSVVGKTSSHILQEWSFAVLAVVVVVFGVIIVARFSDINIVLVYIFSMLLIDDDYVAQIMCVCVDFTIAVVIQLWVGREGAERWRFHWAPFREFDEP